MRDTSNVSDEPALPYVPSPGDGNFSRLYSDYEVFEDAVFGDIDGNGNNYDALLILVADVPNEEQLTSYSVAEAPSLFYAAVVLVENPPTKIDDYKATNPVFLGDRIIPQSFFIEDNLAKITYLTRAPGEDFSVEPSVLESVELRLEGENLSIISAKGLTYVISWHPRAYPSSH